MFNPLTLFSTLKSGVITIAVVAGLTLVGTLWFQKNQAEKAVVELQVQNANLQTAVLKREMEVNGLKIALDTLQETYAEIAEHLAIESDINKEIDNAPPENDGPLAPVLRDTLDSVGRMLGNPAPQG